MADPKSDWGYVVEPKVAFSSFVVSCGDAAGVFELVEAALNHVTGPVKTMIHTDPHLPGFAHGDLGQDIALTHGFPNAITIIAPIRQQHAQLRQVADHHQIKP